MLEFLFLLLPIAVAYGWYMGSRSVEQRIQRGQNKLSRKFVTGINFLLSNQKDQAVDIFLDMLKEENGTLEAHLMLGNLFRSRGEVDRAIRIHQALVESASLSFEQRLLVTFQLGKDYLSAGLYNRAEEMFLQLIEEEDFKVAALEQLLIIYQLISDWIKSIKIAERLVKLGKRENKTQIAQFYCEQAVLAISIEKIEPAITLLKRALSIDKNCVRASITLGRLLLSQHKYPTAVTILKKVLLQDSAFIDEALPLLYQCYQQLELTQEWIDFLKQCTYESTSAVAELMLADELEKIESVTAAQLYITHQLQLHPSLEGFYRLMDYHVADAEDGRAKESLLALRNMVGSSIRATAKYRCHKCGFTVTTLYWHCPGCRSWSSIKPTHDFIKMDK